MALIVSPALWVGAKIPLANQSPMLDGLRNTSAVIFGIMGAWISILFPNALSNIGTILRHRDANGGSASGPIAKERQLLKPIVIALVISSVVLMLLLAMPIISMGFSAWAFPRMYKFGRGLHFYLLVYMSLLEALAILYVIVPAINFNRSAKDAENRQKLLEKLQSRSPGKGHDSE